MSNALETRCLAYSQYFSTAYDLWLGKFIGGTFGAKFEGYKRLLEIDVADLLPLEIVENDDTDLQLLWLHALQEHGTDLDASHLAREWREHVRAPWSEYGVAMANWERGIRPPASGTIDNWFFRNGMGCAIRSEIWGIICPGMPMIAARYAKQDAELDHGGDSVQAEVFLAAVESMLFFERDLERLIEGGLSHVDPASRFARLVPDVVAWSRESPWQEARSRILRHYGHEDFTNSPQNMGFLLLALLSGGGDFVQTMKIAIGCGYDTDCTAATAGAILNGINGTETLPGEIAEAVGDRYLISSWMSGFPQGGSLTELTHACCQIGIQVARSAEREQAASVRISSAESAPRIEPLPVESQALSPIEPVAKPFPDWIALGPFFRDWTEIAPQKEDYPDHGKPELPSVRYMTQRHSGFDTDFIDMARLSLDGWQAASQPEFYRQAIRCVDSRLSLESLPDAGGPCTFYACAEFESPDESRNWLLAGSAGPIELWLNGRRILKSATYQPLNPCTFDAEVTLQEGLNRIALKLEKTSQPAEAFLQFKRHSGKHWHQCFINTSLDWRPLAESGDGLAGSV